MTNPGDAAAHSGDAPTAGHEAALPDKPILEWTEEDWARWIAGPAAGEPSAAVGDAGSAVSHSGPAPPEGGAEGPGDAADEPVAVAGDGDGGADEPASAGDPVRPPGEHAEEPDAEPGAAGDGPGDRKGADAAAPPPAGEPAPADEAGEWVPEIPPERAEPAAEDRWELGAADPEEPAALAVAAEDAGEPAARLAAGTGSADPPATDADDRPWWEATRRPPTPRPLADPDAGRDDAAAATRALTGLAAPVPPAAPVRVASGRTPSRGAPVTGVRPAPPRAAPAVVERTHRVRSAFGLLGVAVLVGMMVAGLITVAIFAISVALRRAVG